jgi:isopenicillin-N N-acyltransferase-like protein
MASVHTQAPAGTLRSITTHQVEPRARGLEAGAMLAAQVEVVEHSYRSLFAVTAGWQDADVQRFGEQVLRRVAPWRPALVAELEGFAEGCGRPVELVAALNARTEVVAGSECSSVGRIAGEGPPWLAQNWDWYTDAPGRCLVWSCAVEGGRYLTMTEAGLLAKVGVSSRGLAVTLNILHHARDGGPVGVPVHLLLREILATCESVEDVAAVLAEAPTSASSAVTAIDAGGGGAAFELSPAGVGRVEPDEAGRVVHTNHFLDPALAGGEMNESLDGSRARLAVLERERPEALEDARRVLCDHSSAPQTVCRHSDASTPGLPPTGTVVSLLMEPAAGRMAVAAGPPCSTAFAAHEMAV